MVAASVAIAAAVLAPFSGAPNPTSTVGTYRVTVQTEGGFVRHVVAGPQRFSSNPTDPRLPNILARAGVRFEGATRTSPGRRIVNRYQSEPDGVNGPDDLGLDLARFAVTEARAGKLNLIPATADGRAALRAVIDLPPNSCRGLPAGTATLWMTRTTLLPRRLEVERDGEESVFTYRFEGFNQGLSLGPVPTLRGNAQQVNDGFRQVSPARAAGPLAFRPRLPRVLPPGFRLVTSGWAPRGARTGVDGRNRRDTSLFTAVYTRGWERIEITQRVAVNGTWAVSPFSASCLRMDTGRALVNNRGARYGIGTQITSHLWWREGSILFTVSGPFPKRDLQAIGESLAPI